MSDHPPSSAAHWPSQILRIGLALLLGACSPPSKQETLQVFAASSLTDAFGALEEAFEQKNPGSEVAISFAGSQVLRLQIEQGAPADVFASADPHHMQTLVDAGRIRDSRIFAHNQLTVITPRNNPAGIETFQDLPAARRLIVGSQSVPVGSYTAEVLRRSEAVFGTDFVQTVHRQVVSQENNVRLIRAKVALGEADAAIVYRTDAISSSQVREVQIPAEVNVAAEYLIGRIEGTERSQGAAQWVAFVTSDAGQAILESHGFGASQ